MNDQPPKPLADDRAFLDSLSDLDQGLGDRVTQRPAAPAVPVPPSISRTATASPMRPPAPSGPRPSAPPAVRHTPPLSGSPPLVPRQSGGRRALLDLFPKELTAPPPGAPPPSPAAPCAPSAPAAPTAVQTPRAASPPRAGAPPPPDPPAFQRLSLNDVLATGLDDKLTYQEFYGLNEPPFSTSSDPRFLYHSTAHDRVAQELLSAIRRHDGIVILTGQIGLGKTMLCRAVLDQLDRRTLTSFVLDPFASIEDILQTILVDFGVISRADLASGRLANASRHDLATALREFLASLAALQAFAVVVIDDAHNLAIGVLDQIRVLTEAEVESRLLQVVLVGQPRLLTVLRRTELRELVERASVRSVLEPLDDEEVTGYVLHRLAVAGTNTRVKFDPAALARLSLLSGGVPRIINLLCDRALTLGYDASATVIDRPLVDRAADALEIAAPEPQWLRLARAALAIAALVVLMLVGAGAAALVFHDRVARTITRWQNTPPAPRRPALRQSAPFAPAPSPAATPSPGPAQPPPRK